MRKRDKRILALIDGMPVKDCIRQLQESIDWPAEKLKEAVDDCYRRGLIIKEAVPEGDTRIERYRHTQKVTQQMLGDPDHKTRRGGSEEIRYYVESVREEDNILAIEAGKRWTEQRVRRYDGIHIKIPAEVRHRELTFAVMGISRYDTDMYRLRLHAHGPMPEQRYTGSECFIDMGGNVDTSLFVSKELLKKWTRLSGRAIDAGIGSINMGATYNLMLALPRVVRTEGDAIIILKNKPNLIDALNVCNLLFANSHPIDQQ